MSDGALRLSRRTLLISSAALALPWRAEAAAANVLRRGNRFEPNALDPHLYNTAYEAAIVLDLFSGLVAYDNEGRPGPGLALSWSTTPDGKRYTFSLRPGLAWSDGKPLTADDVVYSLRRLMDPKTAGVFAPLLYLIGNGRAVNTGAAAPETLAVSAPDPLTVVIDLDAPAPYLTEILANGFAAVVPRHVITAHGEGWTRPGVMVSSGAFMLEAWQPQERVTLARNPKFYDAANVKLARVDYIPTGDVNSGLARFRAGELDTQLDVPLSQVDRLRQDLPVETRLTPTLLTYYLTLNTASPKLSDLRVRRALSLAIDRDVLTGKVLRGGESPAFSFVPPMVPGYTPATLDFADTAGEARLNEARRLVAEAGYGPGKPLRIVYSHSSNLDLRRIAVIIAGMWKRIGVETTLLNTEGKVHFANLRQGNFEAAFVGWQADFNDPSSFLYVLESASTRSNYARYRNSSYDALLSKAAASENAVARSALLRQAEALAMQDQPIIPLYFGVTKSLVSQRVIGWRANAVDIHPSRYLSLAN
jgi:oligopeptide transport system substrate-binding protein